MGNFIETFIAGLSPKERKILYVTLGVVSLALFDRLLIAPIVRESRSVEEAINANIGEIKKSTLILRYKDKIIRDNDDYGIFYTADGLSQEQLTASFLSEIEEFAKASTIALTNINPVVTEEKAGYVQYSIVIECAGNMKNIVDFIYAIDNAKKPLRVVSYNIQPKDRNVYDVKCSMTITRAIISRQVSAPAAKDVPEDAAKKTAKDTAAAPS
ncbi:MAG: type 4a pilus biogenesis protein PilO [Candidatus Omnitrophota bacterium]